MKYRCWQNLHGSGVYRYTFIDRDQGQRAFCQSPELLRSCSYGWRHLTCQRNQSMFCFTFQCFIFNQPFTSNVYFMIRWLHINFNHKFLPKCWRKTRHSGPLTERSPFSSISFSGPHLLLFELLLKNKEIVNSIGLYKIPLIKV